MPTLQNALYSDGFKAGNKTKIGSVETSDFAYSVGDPIPLIDTSLGEVVVTLPPITDWPDEAYRHNIPIVHSAGANNVKVQLSGAETFAWGNTYFNLGTGIGDYPFAAVRNGSMVKYGFMGHLLVAALAKRSASWAASNFSSMTIIPMDGESYNDNNELITYTSGASFRYTLLAAGDYYVTHRETIDSTGGSTWNATAEIFKNGTTLGESYRTRTGNYGNEDNSMALPKTKITGLSAGDYLDLRIDQNSLTGNLIFASLAVEMCI